MTPFPLLQRFELAGRQNVLRPIAERMAAQSLSAGIVKWLFADYIEA